MSATMEKDRLLKTADYLDTVVRNVPERFDMSFWGIDDPAKKDCGTVCCAFGHAPSIPEFFALGLCLAGQNSSGTYTVQFKTEGGKVYRGADAAVTFYGITMTQVNYLFMPENYGEEQRDETYAVTLDAVVNRIRNFVASGGEMPDDEDPDDQESEEAEEEDEDW